MCVCLGVCVCVCGPERGWGAVNFTIGIIEVRCIWLMVERGRGRVEEGRRGEYRLVCVASVLLMCC